MLFDSEVEKLIKVGTIYKIKDPKALGVNIDKMTITSKYKDGFELNGYLGMDYWVAQFYLDLGGTKW